MISPTKIVDGKPDDGAEPMTDNQAAELRQLCEEAGDIFDASLSKHEAQRRIAALQELK